jgi:hypothetical protein
MFGVYTFFYGTESETDKPLQEKYKISYFRHLSRSLKAVLNALCSMQGMQLIAASLATWRRKQVSLLPS